MMMKDWSFYDVASGALVGRTFHGPLAYLAQNTPPGCAAVEGVHDHLSQRVDLASGAVVDWQPPAPADTEFFTHAWVARRWVALPTPAERRRVDRQRLAERIAAVEAGQARALREAVLQTDPGAVARLQAIEQQIAALRAEMAEA
jgi:hypothetical protein